VLNLNNGFRRTIEYREREPQKYKFLINFGMGQAAGAKDDDDKWIKKASERILINDDIETAHFNCGKLVFLFN